MRKKTNIIEINGKRYDAATGALLLAAEVAETPNNTSVAKAAPAARSISVQNTVKQPRPAARRSAPHQLSRNPAPAHTLMRQAVHKPAPSLKRRIKVTGHTDKLVPRPLVIAPPRPPARQPDKRLQHASQIAKSRLVNRFSAGTFILPPDQPLPSPTPQTSQITSPAPPRSATADLLEQALQRATSHLEPAPKVARRRFHRKHQTHVSVA